MTPRRTILRATLAGIALASIAPYLHGQTRPRRIGFLWERDQSDYADQLGAFKAGMRELGYTEGADYVIEHRSAQNDPARVPALVAELIALKVELIAPSGTPSAVIAHDTTREIPILIMNVGDPVGSGLAANLRRPGGNVTGLTSISVELYTKRLDLLRQVLPNMRRVGLLYNPDNGNDRLGLRQFESDCDKLKFKSAAAPVRKPEEIAVAFNTLKGGQAEGVIVSSSQANSAWQKSIIEQAAKHRLPAVYGPGLWAESGGLISYGPNLVDLCRRAAGYVDKIFRGAKPAELPIQQPNKFDLAINLRTAKALGVTIPQSILVSADRVIK